MTKGQAETETAYPLCSLPPPPPSHLERGGLQGTAVREGERPGGVGVLLVQGLAGRVVGGHDAGRTARRGQGGVGVEVALGLGPEKQCGAGGWGRGGAGQAGLAPQPGPDGCAPEGGSERGGGPTQCVGREGSTRHVSVHGIWDTPDCAPSPAPLPPFPNPPTQTRPPDLPPTR